MSRSRTEDRQAVRAANAPLLGRLHVRLSILSGVLMAIAGASLWALHAHYGERAAVENAQRLNLGLAQYIVDHQPRPLIDADGRPDAALMVEMAEMVMRINPWVEVYLLAADGRLLAHALDGAPALVAAVDVGRIASLLASDVPDMLPVEGDDPRHPGRSAAVSVARIGADRAARGYLYIVLRSQLQPGAVASLDNSRATRAAAAGLTLVLGGAVISLALAFTGLTRPLRRLTAELARFRLDTPSGVQASRGGEVEQLVEATRAMRQRIAEQFARLEQADRQRRELVGNLSHDLHTPLANILGYLETVQIKGEALDAQARRQFLGTALENARRLDRRIGELFELSRLEGRVAPRMEVFRLAELLQDVVQGYRLEAERRGVTLEAVAGDLAQASVRADIALIERVLQNLVDNALRYTPRGGHVCLALGEADASRLTVTVSDTGVGIPHEHLPYIFERYWRGEPPARPGAASRSAGLGLAIVKRIVELHGSTVVVQTALSRGTRFSFALPRAQPG